MNINKNQLFVLWMAIILIIIAMGSRTSTVFPLDEIMKPNGPERGHTALFLYGTMVLCSSEAGYCYPFLQLGKYKYHVILSIALLTALTVYSIRNCGHIERQDAVLMKEHIVNWKRGFNRIIWVVSVIASVTVGTGAALEWYNAGIYGEHTRKTFLTSILWGFVFGFVGFAASWIAYWILTSILKWIKSGFADQPLASEGKSI